MKRWIDLEFFKKDWQPLKKILREEQKKGKPVLPMAEGYQNIKIFNALIFTPRHKVKVVILGQDPYPNREHAMGLAFGVPRGTFPLPPSLQNILKELEDDYGEYFTDPSLTLWAKQGVLLLNTSLTVEEKKPGSHANLGWDKLTKQIVEALSEDGPKAWILWGNHARGFKQYIKNKQDHFIVESAHPSPLAAHKGFFGSRPFSKVNCWLESVNEDAVVW